MGSIWFAQPDITRPPFGGFFFGMRPTSRSPARTAASGPAKPSAPLLPRVVPGQQSPSGRLEVGLDPGAQREPRRLHHRRRATMRPPVRLVVGVGPQRLPVSGRTPGFHVFRRSRSRSRRCSTLPANVRERGLSTRTTRRCGRRWISWSASCCRPAGTTPPPGGGRGCRRTGRSLPPSATAPTGISTPRPYGRSNSTVRQVW